LHRCLGYVAWLQASDFIDALNSLLPVARFVRFRKVMDDCVRLCAYVGIDVKFDIICIGSITILTSSPRETHAWWKSAKHILGLTFLPQPKMDSEGPTVTRKCLHASAFPSARNAHS
jgi:hypothetical protein